MLILLVTVDRDLAATCGAYAEDQGHQILIVATGDDALASYATLRPNAIIFDMTALGRAGWSAARALRSSRRGSQVVIAALVDSTLQSDDALAQNARCDLLLVKPMHGAEMVDLIRAAAAARVQGANGEHDVA